MIISQNSVTGFCNRDGVYLLRGTDWVYVRRSGSSWSLFPSGYVFHPKTRLLQEITLGESSKCVWGGCFVYIVLSCCLCGLRSSNAHLSKDWRKLNLWLLELTVSVVRVSDPLRRQECVALMFTSIRTIIYYYYYYYIFQGFYKDIPGANHVFFRVHYYYYYYYYHHHHHHHHHHYHYLLQLTFHSAAVVLTLVTNKNKCT